MGSKRERLSMKDFNGGYIKASQEAYDLLKAMKYEMFDDFLLTDKFIVISENTTYHYKTDMVPNFKQFYINNGALSWDEPYKKGKIPQSMINDLEQMNSMEDELSIIGEEDEKETNYNNDSDVSNGDTNRNSDRENVISIKDDNGVEYIFEKPEFEVLSIIYCNISGMIFGIIKRSRDSVLTVTQWTPKGSCSTNTDYDLTPIKPKWYEDESNFPALAVRGKELHIIIDKLSADYYLHHNTGWRLATKDEVMSLYYEGKDNDFN